VPDDPNFSTLDPGIHAKPGVASVARWQESEKASAKKKKPVWEDWVERNPRKVGSGLWEKEGREGVIHESPLRISLSAIINDAAANGSHNHLGFGNMIGGHGGNVPVQYGQVGLHSFGKFSGPPRNAGSGGGG